VNNNFFDPPAIIKPAEGLATLAGEIKAAHALAEQSTRQGLEHYRHVGELLRKARA
jgi:hypothetical protein